MADPYLVTDPKTLAIGLADLCQIEPAFARVDPARVTLRAREAGFVALAKAIISQQVSVASANAITARLSDAGMLVPEAVLSPRMIRFARAWPEPPEGGVSARTCRRAD